MSKGVMLHTVSRVVAVLSAYIIHFFLAKMMTVGEYGIVGMIINLTNFYYLFLNNGVSQSISKNISLDLYATRQVIRNGMSFLIPLSFGFSLLNLIISPFLAQAFGDSSIALYYQFISILIPFTAIFSGFSGALNGMRLFVLESSVLIVYQLGRLSAIPLSLLFAEKKPLGTIFGFVLASVVAAVLAILFTYKTSRVNYVPDNVRHLSHWKSIKESIYYIVLFAGGVLILNIDTLLLTFIRGSDVLVGQYTAVTNFSMVSYYLVSAVYTVVLPYIAEKYQRGDLQGIAKLISRNLSYIMMAMLPIVLLICLSAKPLMLTFYGKDYLQGTSILVIRTIAIFLLSLYMFFSVCLNTMNMNCHTMVASFILVGLDILLLFLLVPQYGTYGAALSTGIASAVGAVWSYIMLKRKLEAWIKIENTLKIILLLFVFSLLVFLLFSNLVIHGLGFLAVIYLALCILYLLCLAALRLVDLKGILGKIKSMVSKK